MVDFHPGDVANVSAIKSIGGLFSNMLFARILNDGSDASMNHDVNPTPGYPFPVDADMIDIVFAEDGFADVGFELANPHLCSAIQSSKGQILLVRRPDTTLQEDPVTLTFNYPPAIANSVINFPAVPINDALSNLTITIPAVTTTNFEALLFLRRSPTTGYHVYGPFLTYFAPEEPGP